MTLSEKYTHTQKNFEFIYVSYRSTDDHWDDDRVKLAEETRQPMLMNDLEPAQQYWGTLKAYKEKRD